MIIRFCLSKKLITCLKLYFYLSISNYKNVKIGLFDPAHTIGYTIDGLIQNNAYEVRLH